MGFILIYQLRLVSILCSFRFLVSATISLKGMCYHDQSMHVKLRVNIMRIIN